MKQELRLLPLCFLGLLPICAQSLPQLNDGESHGDPPFLVEDGWVPLFDGRDFTGWHGQDGKPHEWFTTKGVRWERIFGPTHLRANPAPGDRMVNGPNGKTANLVTDEKFGDVELYLEFMNAKGSNSGVYMQGLYEVQIFDSYGYSGPMVPGDCGGIYHRGKELGGGSPPLLNACRRPGEWQSLHIWFRAPRFDSGGKKIENAKFVRVLLNGIVVQNDVDVDGPTLAHMNIAEAPLNPLMLQGNHAPIAFRYIYIRPLRPIINR